MRVRLRVAVDGNAMPEGEKHLRDPEQHDLVDVYSDALPGYREALESAISKVPPTDLILHIFREE